MKSLHERFKEYDREFLKFERIESPLNNRPDLCAFLMLDKLIPGGTGDIIASAEHDEFYLNFDCDAFNSAVTDEQLRDLVRCGIRYDAEYDSLCMFA